MPPSEGTLNGGWITGLVLLWLGGMNLRLALLAVPPVIPELHHDLHLDAKAVGALSGLPVILFACGAIIGSVLVEWTTARRALVTGLVVVALGSALRGVGTSTEMLFAMTIVMGIGIAVMQPVMPALVRIWSPGRIGLATAVYLNGLFVGEILSATLTRPVVYPLVDGRWEWAMAVWALPAVVTAVLVLVLAVDMPRPNGRRRRWRPDWRDRQIWYLGLIFGATTSLYFVSNAFLPDYLTHRSRSDLIVPALASVNMGQIPASFLVLFLAERLVGRRWPFFLIGILAATAVAGIMFGGAEWVVAWAGVIGFCAAFLYVITLAVPPMLCAPEEVPNFSAGVFTIAYTISFAAPLIGGTVWDATGEPRMTFSPLVAVLGALFVSAARLRFSRA